MPEVAIARDEDVLPVAPDEGVFSVLDESECQSLLHDGVVGRIGFAQPDLTILPVTYDWVDGLVVFKTSKESSLYRLVGQPVAFEVDDIDAETGVGWSVMLRGVVETGIPEQAEGIRPMAAGQRKEVMVIRPSGFSGRVVSRPEEGR
ncbi:pyridoxamine 5'-phosphate oxidase family protein [Propionibacteriaceae bacterium G1746]|uniref:pyridoxamine 5'-phosphate oxidase family protein n=1 Tax=Aestuariimicrobium sp. G57 TaxID=3418485 RepID=UPI003C29B16A